MQTHGFARQSDLGAPESQSNQDRARIKDAILHELPHSDRLLLVLWHAEGMSPEEIGAVLSMPEAQVIDTHERIVAQLNSAIAPARASA